MHCLVNGSTIIVDKSAITDFHITGQSSCVRGYKSRKYFLTAETAELLLEERDSLNSENVRPLTVVMAAVARKRVEKCIL